MRELGHGFPAQLQARLLRNIKNIKAKGRHQIIRTAQLYRQALTLAWHTRSILVVLNETREGKSESVGRMKGGKRSEEGPQGISYYTRMYLIPVAKRQVL